MENLQEKKGWESEEAAEYYSKTVNIAVPKRDEILSIIARLATENVAEHPKILDLGGGFGEVTSKIIKWKPQALVQLVDFSDEMIRLSKLRFEGNPNIRIIKHDLNKGILGAIEERGFDSVVSCFCLHHIEFSNRVPLYGEIREILKKDGLFINGDLFKGDSPFIDQWEFDNWIAWIVQQSKDKLGANKTFEEVKKTQLETFKRMGDKPGTIWEMQEDLKRAGFRYIDCLWKYQNLAIIAASKSK